VSLKVPEIGIYFPTACRAYARPDSIIASRRPSSIFRKALKRDHSSNDPPLSQCEITNPTMKYAKSSGDIFLTPTLIERGLVSRALKRFPKTIFGFLGTIYGSLMSYHPNRTRSVQRPARSEMGWPAPGGGSVGRSSASRLASVQALKRIA
jgi:hypothetical protein